MLQNNFIGEKYQLDDYLLLNFIETENKDFKTSTQFGNVYYKENSSNFSWIKVDANDDNYLKINDNVTPSLVNRLAYKCRLYISTKELKTRFVYLMLRNEETKGSEILFSELIDLHTAIPTQVINYNNKLYTSYIEIYIPKEEWDNNNNIYATINNVSYEINNTLFTVNVGGGGSKNSNNVYWQYNDLKFESFVNTEILNPFVDFEMEFDDDNFIMLKPVLTNKSQSVKSYIIDKYNSTGFYSKVSLYYDLRFINKQGTTVSYRISNLDDNFEPIHTMINTKSTSLVTDTNNLPLTVFCTMYIEIDNLTLKRENSLQINHGVRTANEVVNKINVANLIGKSVVEKIDVVNQKIVSTPSDKEPIKDIVKLNTPVFGNVIKGVDKKLSSGNNKISFKELENFNLAPNSKIYLKVRNESIIGYYTNNKTVYFDINEFKTVEPEADMKFEIQLITDFNGEPKLQSILVGKFM